MLFVKLLDIYNKINDCPRKMGALEVLCILGDVHRNGVEWVAVGDVAKSTETNPTNVRHAISQMVDQNLIERRYVDKTGQLVDRVTKTPIVRLMPECVEALGGGYETYVQ